MHYIIQFDIAALFLDVLIFIFYMYRRNIPILRNKIYSIILISVFVVTTLDLITSLISSYQLPVSTIIVWIANCLYLSAITFLSVLYLIYISSLIELDSLSLNKRNTLDVILLLPYFFELIIIWLSPFYPQDHMLVFYITPENIYLRGKFWFYLLYGINALYVISAFILLLSYKLNVPIKKRRTLLCYFSIVFISVAIQFLFPNLLVECFGLSLALLIFLFYVQKPEEVLDSVTDLFNQVAFVRMINHYCSNSSKFTVISIILDDTVFIANSFGLKTLNIFMNKVSDFLRQNFNFNSIFYLNQGTFCVVLKNAKSSEINKTIKLFQDRFKETWKHETIEIKLYSRICVINYPDDAATAEETMDIVNLLNHDERYKQSLIFARDIDVEYKKRTVYIEHALRYGLSENRFDVYYQPIYSTKKQRIIGAEALIRLKDEKGEFISPEDFIPIAEKTGTILRIGEFVFESVCKTLSEINTEDYGIEKIDINLSVVQCMQEILAEQILTIKSVYQVPSSIINLEITETAAAHTPEILLNNMKKLSDSGIELSLDDYGSGYSNMNYLLSLPFKMVKIDKYIVWQAYKDERANIALAATISMINSLNMTVLAEGVETIDQAKWLTALGCDYLQGFYYSKPVQKDDFLNLMKKSKTRKL